MQPNHVIVTLCLLGAVALCRGQDPPVIVPTTAPTPAAPSTVPLNSTSTIQTKVPDPTSTVPGPATSVTDNRTPVTDNRTPVTDNRTPVTDPAITVTDPATSVTDPATSVTDPATTEPVEEVPPGLSDGAIAGITIGSIAGVAAVGGGIFGLLKFTGRV